MASDRSLPVKSGVPLVAALVALAASPAIAAFVSPTQWVRSADPRSTYQEWDKFVSSAGPNSPNSPNVPVGAVVDAPPTNPNGTADLIETSGTSFVTGGGNIYSFAAATDFDVTVPNYSEPSASWTTVLVQLSTLGSLLDSASVRVSSGGTTYQPVESALLFSQVLGGFGGVQQDRWFEFHLPGNAASYLVEFNSVESSMSLDRVAVDTAWTSAATPLNAPNPVVPEPGSVGLALGGIGLLFAHRALRRKK